MHLLIIQVWQTVKNIFVLFLEISPWLSPFHTTSLARPKTKSDPGNCTLQSIISVTSIYIITQLEIKVKGIYKIKLMPL